MWNDFIEYFLWDSALLRVEPLPYRVTWIIWIHLWRIKKRTATCLFAPDLKPCFSVSITNYNVPPDTVQVCWFLAISDPTDLVPVEDKSPLFKEFSRACAVEKEKAFLEGFDCAFQKFEAFRFEFLLSVIIYAQTWVPFTLEDPAGWKTKKNWSFN